MEQENNQPEPQVQTQNQLNTVTPLSKYLAMALFIVLPFIGGWIGYTYAPEKVVEKIVVKEVEKEVEVIKTVVVEVGGDNEDITSNVFDYSTVTKGEKFGTMVVNKVTSFTSRREEVEAPPSENDIFIKFIGKTTVIGYLSMPTDNPMDGGTGPEFYIHRLTEPSLKRLPHLKTDTRSTWFGINNPEVIMQSDIKNRDLVEVVIDEYNYELYPSEVWNSAHVVSIKKVE